MEKGSCLAVVQPRLSLKDIVSPFQLGVLPPLSGASWFSVSFVVHPSPVRGGSVLLDYFSGKENFISFSSYYNYRLYSSCLIP